LYPIRVGYEFTTRYGLDAVRVLRLPQNRGKGNAVRQVGFVWCVPPGRGNAFLQSTGLGRRGTLSTVHLVWMATICCVWP